MSRITVQELEELAQQRGGRCTSIYLPTIKASDQVKQNYIRYKNLLDQAEKKLQKAGMESEHIKRYLSEAYVLANDSIFWQQQEDGLAAFISDNGFKTFKLPVSVQEEVIVNDNFYLKPLMSLLYEGGDFYILALSQNNVRLLKGTPYEVNEVDTENIPNNLREALNLDEYQRQLQWHSGTTSPRGQSGGERPAMYHGHGGPEEDKKTRLFQYFQKIDKGLNDMLKEARSPLVLAGVEYLHPIYKEANTYKHLAEKGIQGSPEGVHDEELHREAWKLVEPFFKEARQEITDRFQQLKGQNDQRATMDIKKIIEAAPYGRVEVLFVDKNAKQWGTFDIDKVQAKFQNSPRPENQDLLDFAALQTLLNGGIVYAVEPGQVPGGNSPAAAILRY